jgi:hypothetical protein
MPTSAILDVAIGMAFVYLVLSLICSVVNEGIASMLALRGKNLVRGINNLFSGSTMADGRHFVDAIYAHGLVRGLYRDPTAVNPDDPLKAPTPQPAPAAPAPVSAKATEFVAALHPLVAKLWAQNMAFPSVLARFKDGSFNLPAYIPSRTFSTALIDVIAPPDPARPRTLEDVRTAIGKLPPSPTQQALLSLVAETQNSIFDFQQKVENWFNDSMDRASGWYKRRAQQALLLIALVVTLTLNVDSVRLAQTLWDNPVARQATVDLARNYAEHNQNALNSDPSLKEQARIVSTLGRQMPIPFGWQGWPDRNTLSLLRLLAGWLITILAESGLTGVCSVVAFQVLAV